MQAKPTTNYVWTVTETAEGPVEVAEPVQELAAVEETVSEPVTPAEEAIEELIEPYRKFESVGPDEKVDPPVKEELVQEDESEVLEE